MFFQSFCRPKPEVCLKLVTTSAFSVPTDSPSMTRDEPSYCQLICECGDDSRRKTFIVYEVFSKDCLKRKPRWEYNILIYKSQQDAHAAKFILSDNCSTCFGRHHHPSSGAQNNCNYSIW